MSAKYQSPHEAYSLDDQRKHQLALLKKIAAGATTISKPEEVILLDEFLRHGHVTALESDSLGERHFLDVQVMPSGEAHLRCLLVEALAGDPPSQPVNPPHKK
ncbi:hypothetical protein D3C84_505550 [compost metagenome]